MNENTQALAEAALEKLKGQLCRDIQNWHRVGGRFAQGRQEVRAGLENQVDFLNRVRQPITPPDKATIELSRQLASKLDNGTLRGRADADRVVVMALKAHFDAHGIPQASREAFFQATRKEMTKKFPDAIPKEKERET